MDPRLAQSKARELIREYGPLILEIEKDIEKEVKGTSISGTDAFAYAKEVIRQQSIIEGSKLLMQKINRIASQNDKK